MEEDCEKDFVQMPRELNREIILIPDKLSKLKALMSFNSVCDKLDILDSPNKSRFKKQIRENQVGLNWV